MCFPTHWRKTKTWDSINHGSVIPGGESYAADLERKLSRRMGGCVIPRLRWDVGVTVGLSEILYFLTNIFATSLTDHWILLRKLQRIYGNKWIRTMKRNKAIINTRKKEKIILEQKYIHDYAIGLAVNHVHINRCWYKFNCGVTILRGWEERDWKVIL